MGLIVWGTDSGGATARPRGRGGAGRWAALVLSGALLAAPGYLSSGALGGSARLSDAGAALTAFQDPQEEWLRDAAQASSRTAQAFLDSSPEGQDALRTAVALASIAIEQQGRALGVATPAFREPSPHTVPGEAALALLATHAIVATPELQAELAALDELPAPLQGALTRFLDAFLALQGATRAAYAGLAGVAGPGAHAEPPRLDVTSPAPATGGADGVPWLRASGVDLGAVLAARMSFLEATLAVRDALRTTQSHGSMVLRAPPALVLDLGGGDTQHLEDAALTLDVGGDDVYENNAGGSNLNWGACGFPILAAAGALVDLGGSDRYGSPAQPRSCGANGGGYAGSGLLLDAGEGIDAYSARDGGVNGGGFAGVGLLIDTGGGDRYAAGLVGVNGGAVAGFVAGAVLVPSAGLLLDLGGSDTYTSLGTGANGGGYFASGALLDRAGDDLYRSDGDTGTNGGGFFGSGLLVDAQGHDTYLARNAGANGGARAGVGLLLDAGGNDAYTAGTLNGVNGGASTAGVAFLLDMGGTDRFQQGLAVCQNPTPCTVAPKGTAGAQVDAPGGTA